MTHANGSDDIYTTWRSMFIKTDLLILLINLYRAFPDEYGISTDATKNISYSEYPWTTLLVVLSQKIFHKLERVYGRNATTLITNSRT